MAAVRPAGPEPRITTFEWFEAGSSARLPLVLGLVTAIESDAPSSTIVSVGKLKGGLSIGSMLALGDTPGEYPGLCFSALAATPLRRADRAPPARGFGG